VTSLALLHKVEAGHFNAQFRVGLPYESGVGIEQDYDEAATLVSDGRSMHL